MKNAVTLSIIMLPCFAFAQFSKGQVYVGGTLSTSLQNSNVPAPTTSSNLAKNNSFSISPVIGVFLSPKIAVGGAVSYSSSLQEYDFASYDPNTGVVVSSFQKYKNNGIGISAFTRYYVPISTTIYFALHEQISFNRANSENTQGNGTQETTQQMPNYSIGLSMKPVFIFFPSPKWGIETSIGSIGYSYGRNLPSVSTSNSFSLSAGSFSFGLAYFFAKK